MSFGFGGASSIGWCVDVGRYAIWSFGASAAILRASGVEHCGDSWCQLATGGRGSMVDEAVKVKHVSLAEALAQGPPPAGNLAVPIFSHGSLEVELYTPKGSDPQQPHRRDEVYLVSRGTSAFFDGERRHELGPGSFLFVAAGQVHRFEDFSDDFAVWVFFYGPEGGEAQN